MCDAPHEPVEVPVAGCAQIKIGYDGSQNPGVCLSQPLGVCFNSEFSGNVLAQETKKVDLLWHDRLRRASNIGRHDGKRERKTTRGHMTSPWGEGCWVITSKIAQN